jgi:glycosyltransferase involved in cell wall biosynthesis
MQELPEISVVIPTRARPQLLRRAIRSVLRQTFQRFEVVVVLDGEDSVTEKVIEEFADPRITLLTLHQIAGGSQARNLGVRKARGRYIALLDDDDEWLPTKLELQIELAEACCALNFVVVTEYLYRAEGQPDEIWPAHLPAPREPLSEFLFSSRGGFQTSTYLCPRELLLRVPFTNGLKKHQDWDWFLQLAALPGFQLLVIPEPLSIYWVPQRSRVSVSGHLDWSFSHGWATSQRSLMTRKAYARLVVKICTRSARLQGAGLPALLLLFRDLIRYGNPTPVLFAEFFIAAILPDNLRARLRPAILHLRGAHPRLSAEPDERTVVNPAPQ